MIDAEKLRKDFPILKRKINGKRLVYLDNAATTQKPRQVIEAINDYYEMHNANVHRSIHKLGEEATEAYEEAHKKVADFINAGSEEIVFTKNCTESINLLAYSLSNDLRRGDEIVITQMEHHSNLVPWQQIAKKKGLKLRFAEINAGGKLKLEQLKGLINNKTKIVSVCHVSNVLGTINPVKEIAKIVKGNSNALFIVDAAQSVPCMPVDVKKINCDFLAFTGHKMLGPTGIGVLYGKKELLEKMEPFLYGGDMIKEVTFEYSKWNDLPWKFEAGTPNVAEGIGLGAAIDYLNKIGMRNVLQHEKELTKYAIEKLSEINEAEIYGPKDADRIGSVAFNIKNVHAHDTAAILDSEGIAIRAGHHCAMPLMKVLGINGSARASFNIYNTGEEIDLFIKALNKVKRIMGI